VVIVGCRILSAGRKPNIYTGASIYPALQNLMLAARAEGLGTTLTTTVEFRVREVRKLLGLPSEVVPAAAVMVGYPEGRFGRVVRRPVEEVVHWGRWGSSHR
jgi:nitroreductase